jgi:hypothetical protein
MILSVFVSHWFLPQNSRDGFKGQQSAVSGQRCTLRQCGSSVAKTNTLTHSTKILKTRPRARRHIFFCQRTHRTPARSMASADAADDDNHRKCRRVHGVSGRASSLEAVIDSCLLIVLRLLDTAYPHV